MNAHTHQDASIRYSLVCQQMTVLKAACQRVEYSARDIGWNQNWSHNIVFKPGSKNTQIEFEHFYDGVDFNDSELYCTIVHKTVN